MAGRKTSARSKAGSRAGARKSAKKSARRPARRGAAAKKKQAPRKKRSFTYTLLFWPFRLMAYFTRNMHPIVRWPLRAVGSVVLMGVFVAAVVAAIYMLRSVPYDLDKVSQMPARTLVYARDGKTELGRLHGDNRYIVQYDQVSPHFCEALIAREDSRFYRHFGVDVIGLVRATVENVKRRRLAQGGSTLSIQLAENTYFQPETSRNKPTWKLLDQKFMEMALAVRIELGYSKEEILEHYMNRIFWGHTIRGVEAASRAYFEKPASRLSLSEAAMLAGIIRGPNAFSPFRNIEKATQERDVTLGRMVYNDYITQEEADRAKAEPLRVRPKNRRIVLDTYVMDAVRRELDRILEQENIESGGLTVITTVDHTIQRAAELSLDRKLTAVENRAGYRHQTRKQWLQKPAGRRGTPKYVQGACVVIENKTGAVIAVVGGRSADESKYNRAIQAERQIGSIFKPFVYLTAVNNGMMPQTWIKDSRIVPGEIRGAPRSWSPGNSDGTFGSYITMEDALVRSRNTASVRVGNYAGIERVQQTAEDVGFIDGFPATPSSYLGSWEATPWQVASAYTVFPNNGEWYRPYIIQEIRNSDGERVWPSGSDSGKLVVSAAQRGASWSVAKVLQQVVERGTARVIRNQGFAAPCAGKTGTTDSYKDAWFAGYTSSLTCAVWVGMDRPQTIINRGYGSTLAAPIWTDVMKTASRLGYPAEQFGLVPLTSAELCRWSSGRSTAGCRSQGTSYMALVPEDIAPAPNHYCVVHPLRALAPNRGGRRAAPRAVPVAPRAVPIDD
ncbi:PBP1A family penicillin-binding protein [Verrucomicrobiaceae bacterium N1E253]|uniref:peptidoglycan glycosyltransferase n=1 Tax=Oceaniferula marina TaxID=2748318 RepID=A0A851GCP3_9BACT|nr:PBP1A family penicillin-binding protein [Oceaniferula marina]NWK55333.1 PBP1A family penicillin-binding protein [Oceaniferula marina]